MKHDWEYKKLKDVCRKGSSNIQQNKIVGIDGEYPVYGASGYVQNVDFYHQEHPYIGIVKDGSGVGRVNKYPAKSSLLGTMQYILPNEGMSLGYLVYCLQSLKLSKFAAGAAIPHIYFRDYGECLSPVPALAVQERIVGELDKVREVIEKKKEQLKELERLAGAMFYDMFGDPVENEKGWEVKSMNDVAPLSEYRGEHPDKDGKYWLLNLDKVESQTGRILDIDYYGTDEIGTSVISFDTSNVLYSKLRPYLNKVVIPNQIGYATSELVPLKPQKDILDRYYLAYMLRSNAFVSFINIKVAGAKMPRVSMGTFRGFMVPLPPLTLQQAFAEKVEGIEKQKELITASLKEAERLFDARMEYWFGE